MTIRLFLVAAVLALLCGWSDAVTALTLQSFNSSVVDAPGTSFVKFFAPWCPVCQAVAPKYLEVEASLPDSGIKFYEVDCTYAPAKRVCEAAGVDTYPAFHLYKNGNMIHYSGARETPDMKKFLMTPVADGAWHPPFSRPVLPSFFEVYGSLVIFGVVLLAVVVVVLILFRDDDSPKVTKPATPPSKAD